MIQKIYGLATKSFFSERGYFLNIECTAAFLVLFQQFTRLLKDIEVASENAEPGISAISATVFPQTCARSENSASAIICKNFRLKDAGRA